MTYVDLHIHGAFGIDLLTATPVELDLLAAKLSDRGVSAFLPTLVPVPEAELEPLVARLATWIDSRSAGDERGAFPVGIHFEGPWLSAARCGALRSSCLKQSATEREIDAFVALARTVPGRHMITIAPEIEGGVAAVRAFHRAGFLVSIGHTEASLSTLDDAFHAGARHMTHFANAMKPLHHRDVGPIGWGLLRDDVTIDLVADGEHLSSAMLRLIYRTKHPRNVALISDAAPPAGLPDGDYEVWGQTLTLRKGSIRTANGNLAGAVKLLDECVAHAEDLGIPEAAAHASATEVPRRILEI